MKQEILDIMQATLGLPNNPIAQITVGAQVMYADDFAARLAEELSVSIESIQADAASDAISDHICPECEAREVEGCKGCDYEPESGCEHCGCVCDECGDCGE